MTQSAIMSIIFEWTGIPYHSHPIIVRTVCNTANIFQVGILQSAHLILYHTYQVKSIGMLAGIDICNKDPSFGSTEEQFRMRQVRQRCNFVTIESGRLEILVNLLNIDKRIIRHFPAKNRSIIIYHYYFIS